MDIFYEDAGGKNQKKHQEVNTFENVNKATGPEGSYHVFDSYYNC